MTSVFLADCTFVSSCIKCLAQSFTQKCDITLIVLSAFPLKLV